MSISRIGSGYAAATSITIPGTYQNGDLILIWAFNNAAATAPTVAAGFMAKQTSTLNSVGSALGWKIAGSASETSGTWTNATSLQCLVYRGTSTNKLPIATLSTNGIVNANSNTNILWQALLPMQCAGTSWVVSFAGIKSIDTGIESGPTVLTMQQDNISASDEVCAYDSNGPLSAFQTSSAGNLSSSIGNSVGGTAGSWHTYSIEIMADVNGLKPNRGLRPHPFSPGLAR